LTINFSTKLWRQDSTLVPLPKTFTVHYIDRIVAAINQCLEITPFSLFEEHPMWGSWHPWRCILQCAFGGLCLVLLFTTIISSWKHVRHQFLENGIIISRYSLGSATNWTFFDFLAFNTISTIRMLAR